MLWSGMVIRVGILSSPTTTLTQPRPDGQRWRMLRARPHARNSSSTRSTSREGEAFLMLSWGNTWFRDTGAACPAEDSTSPGKLG